MPSLSRVIVPDRAPPLPILSFGPCTGTLICGGMGAGVSGEELAGAGARRKLIGTVSTVAADRIVSSKLGREVTQHDAVVYLVNEARRISCGNGRIAVNAMRKLDSLYIPSVQGAIDAGADYFFVGAGLALDLAKLVGTSDIGIVPIVSSDRALRAICNSWGRVGRKPSFVILEDSRAGGHLGFSADDLKQPGNTLHELFNPLMEMIATLGLGPIPVIVAGGIWDRADITYWIGRGAAGVQMGTRFLATEESGACQAFKDALVAATAKDIKVVCGAPDGSPSHMPFRVITSTLDAAMQRISQPNRPTCLRYMLQPGDDGKITCPALHNKAMCICNGLLRACGGGEEHGPMICTCGENGARVTKIVPVNDLIDELLGITP
jgi:nitronate monooxygenase